MPTRTTCSHSRCRPREAGSRLRARRISPGSSRRATRRRNGPVVRTFRRGSSASAPISSFRTTVRTTQAISNSAQRGQLELATFHLDRGRQLFEQEQDREALLELKRAIYLSPYEAAAHLLIGRIHLRAGRPADAVEALKISIWSEDSAPAHVVLARAYLSMKNSAAARNELQKALEIDPASSEARQLLDTIK